MTISIQTFTTIVSNTVAAIQGSARVLVDLTVGSVLRSYAEAVSAIALWLQGIALQVAALTRFATSNGSDADSWGADFGFTRLPAQAAQGQVTFARFTPTAAATVLVGTIVQTADGTQKYAVIADTAQTAFNAGVGGYVLPAATASITATVQSTSAAFAGNAAVGAINTIAASIPGVDTVTNASAFSNGADAESDAAYRARFPIYLASLSEGTVAAIRNAVVSLQQTVSYTPTENFNYSGASQPGYFYVVVDDGSGAPASSFLTSVGLAIEAVRPITSTYGVFAPTLVTANVAMTLTTAAGYTHSAVVAAVTAALQAYIGTLAVGVTLPFSRLAQVAYAASPGVTNVSGTTLNGSGADLAATAQQRIMVGTLTVS